MMIYTALRWLNVSTVPLIVRVVWMEITTHVKLEDLSRQHQAEVTALHQRYELLRNVQKLDRWTASDHRLWCEQLRAVNLGLTVPVPRPMLNTERTDQ